MKFNYLIVCIVYTLVGYIYGLKPQCTTGSYPAYDIKTNELVSCITLQSPRALDEGFEGELAVSEVNISPQATANSYAKITVYVERKNILKGIELPKQGQLVPSLCPLQVVKVGDVVEIEFLTSGSVFTQYAPELQYDESIVKPLKDGIVKQDPEKIGAPVSHIKRFQVQKVPSGRGNKLPITVFILHKDVPNLYCLHIEPADKKAKPQTYRLQPGSSNMLRIARGEKFALLYPHEKDQTKCVPHFTNANTKEKSGFITFRKKTTLRSIDIPFYVRTYTAGTTSEIVFPLDCGHQRLIIAVETYKPLERFNTEV